MQVVKVAFAALVAAAVLVPAVAEAAGRPKPKYDPNQMICEPRQESAPA